MENLNLISGYFAQVSWLWYAAAVFISFGLGALWFTMLFRSLWIKAVNYTCPCGSDIAKGEKCICKPEFPVELVLQFISTAIVGLFYFILTPVSIGLAIFACIAFSAWAKSMLKFQVRDWDRYMKLAWIEVGYFVVVSIIFILMSRL